MYTRCTDFASMKQLSASCCDFFVVARLMVDPCGVAASLPPSRGAESGKWREEGHGERNSSGNGIVINGFKTNVVF